MRLNSAITRKDTLRSEW